MHYLSQISPPTLHYFHSIIFSRFYKATKICSKFIQSFLFFSSIRSSIYRNKHPSVSVVHRMALQFYGASGWTISLTRNYGSHKVVALQSMVRDQQWPMKRKERRSSMGFRARASLDATAAAAIVADVGQVTEVSLNTFWPIVEAAGSKAVVLDMYTQWCGPCKVIAPKYQELSKKYQDVVFLKLDCNQENKPLAKELGIKVVPTFKILKDGKVVKEVTGAKFDDLVVAIEHARSTQ